jgi:RNA polymerase sigma-70 factor (ECF subfamily)
MPPLNSYSEKELLYRLRNHDRDAFNEIYKKYHTRLRDYVLKFIRIPQYAEDIVQDLFLKIWEVRESIDPEKYFPGYLFTITRNLVFKFLKTAAHNIEVLDEVIIAAAPPGAENDYLMEWKELSNEIQNAIKLLPPKRLEVFLLCREQKMSYDEVSSKLGISRNTIKEHMVLAMRFIKDYLKTRSLP